MSNPSSTMSSSYQPEPASHVSSHSGDHAALTRPLEEGADVNEVCFGMTLLTHAIELEGDSALRSGQPIDSALTATVLAYGADPTATPDGGSSAYEMARFYDHDMAIRVLDRFTARHG
ncbi:ankyrin repeat domain-containing protein [Streptomyces sp. NPDC048018]|uniref:ankyrin repeat domain-containing protein n=1 Tax=Streptomyces sp. NPDC048018 TaxID=3365499 RepID=UPI00371A24D8